MDCRGVIFGEMNSFHAGAVSAYSRKLYSEFGSIEVDDRLAYDDYVYAMRLRILRGEYLFFDDRLVKYRLGSGVSSAFHGYRQTMARTFMSALASHRQSEKDALEHQVELDDAKEMERFESLIKLWNGRTFRDRYDGCLKLKVFQSWPFRLRLLALLLLTGKLSDPVLDLCRTVKFNCDRLRWKLKHWKGVD